MTFSNALPIQFWSVDDDTFNDLEVCGITSVCWCAPIEMADLIAIQFEDDGSTSPAGHYNLAVYDEYEILQNPTTVGTDGDAFTESGDLRTFTDGASDVFTTVGRKSLKIYDRSSTKVDITLPQDWNDSVDQPSTVFAAKIGTLFIGDGAPGIGNLAYQDAVIPAGQSFGITFSATTTAQESIVLFWLSDNADINTHAVLSRVVQANYPTYFDESRGDVMGVVLPTGSSTVKMQIKNTSGSASSRLWIYVLNSEASTTIQVTLNVKILFIPYVGKTDCLSVKESHSCTNLISYRNNSDFAGLVYTDASPDFQFNLRVPSVFFHEEPFDESEDHELSSDTMVQIWAKLERKKQLEIDYIPYYFHEKLRLILAHQSVEVNGKAWIKKRDDPYTIVRTGNKRYPLNKGSVLLTDKNFIKRNLL